MLLKMPIGLRLRMLALSKVFVDAGWCKTSMIPILA